jgi:hypothetical protein
MHRGPQVSGYTKLFGSIVHSTIWHSPKDVKILWITMLALAEADGTVEASVPGLAAASGLTLPECSEALTVLESPDPWSKNPENEGRRVTKSEGGWTILNYLNYRNKLTVSQRRDANAERVRRHREKKATEKAKEQPPPVEQPPDDFNGSPNETICPANLLEQATPKVLPELAAKLKGATLEQVSLSAGRMVAHYVIGKGMGQRRRFWMRELRDWVTKDHGSNKLTNGAKPPRNVGAQWAERAARLRAEEEAKERAAE